MSWEIHPASKLENFASEWNGLRKQSGHKALLHLDFVIPLVKHFGTDKELLTIYKEQSTIKAMGIVVHKGRGIWETFQPSQAPVGIWMQESSIDFAQLLPTLVDALPGLALTLAVTQQDADIVPKEQASRLITYLDYIQTARVTITTSFEEYWSQRGKNLRQNVKKQKNALAKESITPRLDVIASPTEIRTVLQDYGKLESAGWKASNGTAISEDNDQGKFYLEMLTRFAQRDCARIYRCMFNDKVVAIDLCIEDSDQIVVLKTTYDESIRSVSPATLLRYDYFQTIFEEKRINRIEFYGKVMDWHTKWTDEIRDIYHVNCYRWQWLPHLKRLLSKPSSTTAEKEEATNE